MPPRPMPLGPCPEPLLPPFVIASPNACNRTHCCCLPFATHVKQLQVRSRSYRCSSRVSTLQRVGRLDEEQGIQGAADSVGKSDAEGRRRHAASPQLPHVFAFHSSFTAPPMPGPAAARQGSQGVRSAGWVCKACARLPAGCAGSGQVPQKMLKAPSMCGITYHRVRAWSTPLL
jgi:hypothetical protein